MEMRPTVTIDTNALDGHHADKLAAAVAGKWIVIPYVVFFEIFNSPNWQRHAIDSMSRLYPHIPDVVAGDNLTRLYRVEMFTNRPADYKIADRLLTHRMRHAIRLCARSPQEARRMFGTDSRVQELQAEMHRRQQRTYGARARTDAVIQEFRDNFSAEELTNARTNFSLIPELMRKAGFIRLTKASMRSAVAQRPGKSRFDPDLMARTDCAFNRYNLLHFVNVVMTKEDEKPYTDRKPGKVLGSHHDLEVATLGTYTSTLYTNDARAKTLHDALRYTIRMMFPDGVLGDQWCVLP